MGKYKHNEDAKSHTSLPRMVRYLCSCELIAWADLRISRNSDQCHPSQQPTLTLILSQLRPLAWARFRSKSWHSTQKMHQYVCQRNGTVKSVGQKLTGTALLFLLSTRGPWSRDHRPSTTTLRGNHFRDCDHIAMRLTPAQHGTSLCKSKKGKGE